jgi:hypothetical protein
MEKIKACVFIGPEIHQLFRDYNVLHKTQFLRSHLQSFPVNCGVTSDEHGECFHQDISVMQNRYKGKWSAAMLTDYCGAVKRDAPEIRYKQQARRCLI